MTHSSSSSIETLRHQSEQSRARLKSTISRFNQAVSETSDEIKTTLSPDHLKQEARAYVRDKRASVVQNLKENVTNHPLEALAIGAVTAYPLLGMLKRVPIPLALIGAGLVLSRATSSPAARAPDGLHDDDGQDTAEAGLGERLRGGLKDMQGAVASASAGAADTLGGMASAAAAGVQSRAQDFASGAARAGRETTDGLTNLVQRNPLLAGGVAIAVGGFIAASLPTLRMEERVLGKGGEALKDTARQAADGVVSGARAEAARVADNISTAAHEEGLTGEALDQAVDSVAEKVAAVVDRGVEAAIGGADTQRRQTKDGDENARL